VGELWFIVDRDFLALPDVGRLVIRSINR